MPVHFHTVVIKIQRELAEIESDKRSDFLPVGVLPYYTLKALYKGFETGI